MGLFKEFKDDFSQAVNELVPGDVPEKEVEPKAQTADNLVVDTIGENVDVASELSKLDGLLEHVEEQPQETTVPRPTPSENFAEHTINTQKEEQIPQMNPNAVRYACFAESLRNAAAVSRESVLAAGIA